MWLGGFRGRWSQERKRSPTVCADKEPGKLRRHPRGRVWIRWSDRVRVLTFLPAVSRPWVQAQGDSLDGGEQRRKGTGGVVPVSSQVSGRATLSYESPERSQRLYS